MSPKVTGQALFISQILHAQPSYDTAAASPKGTVWLTVGQYPSLTHIALTCILTHT